MRRQLNILKNKPPDKATSALSGGFWVYGSGFFEIAGECERGEAAADTKCQPAPPRASLGVGRPPKAGGGFASQRKRLGNYVFIEKD